jgi:hypothetical protein
MKMYEEVAGAPLFTPLADGSFSLHSQENDLNSAAENPVLGSDHSATVSYSLGL